MDTNEANQKKHTLELSDEEAFVLMLAMETFCDIEDGEYRKAVSIAEGVWSRLPKTNLTWKDVSSR